MYDEKTMEPLNNITSCFKTLIIQMQSINDHLSWISKAQKRKYWSVAKGGYPIKCVDCKKIHAYSTEVLNSADLKSGICEKCRKKSYQDCYKIRDEAGRVSEIEKELHDKHSPSK